MKKLMILGAAASLSSCGGGSGAGEATPGEPVHVAECGNLIRAQLVRPESYDFRAAEDVQSYRRFTRVIFRANLESGATIGCEATCGITKDGQLEPRLAGITAPGNGQPAAPACLAARPLEAAR